MNIRDFENSVYEYKLQKRRVEEERCLYNRKTLGYYYLTVFKPVFEKELDSYFKDVFGCSSTIQFFPAGEGYFVIRPNEYDPIFFKFYFFTDSGDYSASLIANLVYIKFSYYTVSDDLFKISSKGYDDFIGKKFDHFINWGHYKNPTSDKQLIDDLSTFVIDMLGLTDSYKDFLVRERKLLTGEGVF